MLNAAKAAKVGRRMEQELAAMRSVYFLVFNLKSSDKPQSVARNNNTERRFTTTTQHVAISN